MKSVPNGTVRYLAKSKAKETDALKLILVPPWYLCFFLGVQHFLTCFGSTVSIPLILAPAFCLADDTGMSFNLTSQLSLLWANAILCHFCHPPINFKPLFKTVFKDHKNDAESNYMVINNVRLVLSMPELGIISWVLVRG